MNPGFFRVLLFPLLLGTGLLIQGISSQSSGAEGSPSLIPDKTIVGDIRPKSIGHSGTGRFFAQNMMYRHSVTVYDRNFTLIRTIRDRIDFADYQPVGYTGEADGAPVEIAFSSSGETAWVSNYRMFGREFNNPGSDNCVQSTGYDHGFIYQIDTRTLSIDKIIEVGCVPKFLRATPDGKYLLVSNWCSGDVSIVDLREGKEIKRLPVGAYPRGIAIDSNSRTAYVALMGEGRLAMINLADFTISWIQDLGKTPRHLLLGPSDRFLYVSLSRPGEVLKYDLVRREVVSRRKIGEEARTMAMSSDQQYLYVTDYEGDQLVKVHTDGLRLVETVATNSKPIGVTVDYTTGKVWVACYTGSIQVFQDLDYEASRVHHTALMSGTVPTATPYRPGVRSSSGDPRNYLYGQPTGQMSIFRQPSASPVPVAAVPSSSIAIASTNQRQRSAPVREAQFHIIVASFTSKGPAENYVARLSGSANVTPEILEQEGRFRISVGTFADKASAENRLSYIQSHVEQNAWILKP